MSTFLLIILIVERSCETDLFEIFTYFYLPYVFIMYLLSFGFILLVLLMESLCTKVNKTILIYFIYQILMK